MRYSLLLSLLITTFSFGALDWNSIPVKIKAAKVGEMYEEDLSQYTNNPAAAGIIIGLRNPPSWLEMVKNPAGNQVILRSKIPVPVSEMGKTVALRLDLSSNIDGGNLDQPGELFVQWIPQWNPAGTVNLGNFEEGKSYTVDLLNFLNNANKVSNLKITVSIPPQYPWITFDNNHTLTIAPPGGAPNHPNVGPFKDLVLTATADGGTDSAAGIGNVEKVITPPSWLPITTLMNATEDLPYSVDLAITYLLHPENTPGMCGFVTGFEHSWLKISNSCVITGKPDKTHLNLPKKARIFFATVIDGKSYRTEAEISVTIDHVNHKPTWNVKEIDFGKIFTKDFFSRELKNSVSDYDDNDQGKLTISIIDNVTGHIWAKMNGTKFEGTPQKPDVTSPNKARWTVRVTDLAGESDDATILVEVIKANEPPIWRTQNIQLMTAFEDLKYAGDNLNPHIFDEDGDPIKCTLVKGPSWLRVTPDCMVVAGLTNPTANDVGIQSLTVKIDDNKSTNGPTNDKIIVEVKHTNHPPKFAWSPIVINATEDKEITVEFKNYVNDQDIIKFGDSLTYKLDYVPIPGKLVTDWRTSFDINTGKFVGTPRENEVPESKFQLTVNDTFGAMAVADVIFQVKGVVKPPKWLTCPIPFPDAKEREKYSFLLANHVSNKSGSKLSYFSVAGKSQPAWMNIDINGVVTGTPQRSHVGGPFKFTIRVADNFGNFDDCESTVNVLKVPYAPSWKVAEIDLGQCFENSTCTDFELKDWVLNPDNVPLEFGKIDPLTPTWIVVEKNGTVKRTAPGISPDKKKKFTARFFVSDGTNKPEVNAFTEIIKRNLQPYCPSSVDLTYSVTENSIAKDNLAKKVVDPDGDQLFFNPINFDATWTKLEVDGSLELKPRHKQITDGGVFDFDFRVTDNFTNPIECKIKVNVTPAEVQPPQWTQDPIYLSGQIGVPLSYDLKNYVTDAVYQKSDLTFKLVQDNGNQWLLWNAKGLLGGSPKALGNFSFVFEACNPRACTKDKGNVIIVVKEASKPEELEVALFENCNGSALDQFWILDNTDKCSQFMQSLRANIGVYYDYLDGKNLKSYVYYHHSLILNAHAKNWDGQPVRQLNSKNVPVRPYVMSYEHSPRILREDFIDRSLITINKDPDRSFFAFDNRCGGHCYNSPIWDFFRFLTKNEGEKKNIWSLNSQDFFLKNVPTEVMIITTQMDHYKTYNASTPQSSWDPEDFVNDFIKTHKKYQKPLTISAIGPKSTKLVSDDVKLAGPANAYQTLVDKTNGKYWERDCNFDVKSALEEYSVKTTQNACVFNKTKIPLKATVKADSIQVFIGGKEYLSSSGAWTFNPVDTTVYINWSQVDTSSLRPGDKILIKYKA